MTKIRDSLLLNQPSELKQLDLPGIPEKFLKAAEHRGEFTGTRLFAQKPEVYQAVVYCLAEGFGMIRIGKLLKVSPNTVMAVRDREGEAVDIEKERLSNLYRRGARLAGERIVEDLLDDDIARKIPANQKAVIVGILTEKSELLSGGATSRVAHAQVEPSNADYDAYLAGLEVIEVSIVKSGKKQKEKGSKPLEIAESGADTPELETEPRDVALDE